jgi:hypothetical protein
MTYKDMLGPDGTENNMGGTEQFFFFISHSDVLTFKKPDPADAATDDAYVISEAHVCKSGKKFFKMYATIDTTELEMALNGDIDGQSFKPTFKFFHPGSKKELITFINRIKNDKFLVIVPLADGTLIQIGTEKFVAYMKPNFKSEKTSGRGKGAEFEVMAFQPDIYLYDATIPVTPAA